jgi:hypothetical protein
MSSHAETATASPGKELGWRGYALPSLQQGFPRPGSVQVRAGATVAVGDWLGSAGNSLPPRLKAESP